MSAHIPRLASLQEVIQHYGLRTKKSLGQHFLLDQYLTDQIAGLAGDIRGCNAIEIGPGPGGLTRSIIAAKPAALYLIEMDARCIEALSLLSHHSDAPLHIIEGDATKISLPELCSGPRVIIANLPYNVGTDMLLSWLRDIERDASSYQSLTLMFQKEVAERIAAPVASKAYGRISILAQWLCDVKMLLPVPASAFSPPPKVESMVIQLIPRAKPVAEADRAALEKVVAVAFQQRRKKIKTAIKSLNIDVEALGIDPALRPDQLDVVQYASLARAYIACQ